VLTVLKSGNLSLLEPSGNVQACNGIAFFQEKAPYKIWRIKTAKTCPEAVRFLFIFFLSFQEILSGAAKANTRCKTHTNLKQQIFLVNF